MAGKSLIAGTERALIMLRGLPRVALDNIKDNKTIKSSWHRGRAQHGGDKHGHGNKGSGQRQNYMRIGYETGNAPFYLRFKREPYYFRQHLRRQYPPISLQSLQLMIDTDRIDSSQPIDIITFFQSGLYDIHPGEKQFGVQLTDEGLDIFKAKINIEVQWASEQVIAAIERNGGVITTAYYDPHCLQAMRDPMKFFESGVAIPKRMIPPLDALEFYTGAGTRGYLADPEEVSKQRLLLAQKYGYLLPKIEDDPQYEMLMMRKDPRQIFTGLEPGWVISLRDKCIFKPTDKELLEYYST